MDGVTSIDHIIKLQRVYGEAAATATVVRNILAPVAGLQLDDPDLHRRCVLVKSISTYMDALATFAPFGAVEAVATWSYLGVVVFSSSSAAALALRGLARSPIGHCGAVPSLGLAVAYRFIPWAEIKVQPESAVASSATPPEPSRKARALAFREMCERKPMIEYYDPSCPLMLAFPVPPGTQMFLPSRDDSLISGPTMGHDGHLWMHGTLVKYYDMGVEVSEVSVRVRQEQVGSAKIRVTPIEPIVYVPYKDY
uniref:Uncharacterized protein n=1 Tax=Avena sativa TaxID=4498 RepID=A0ACD5ZIN6_AVESA